MGVWCCCLTKKSTYTPEPNMSSGSDFMKIDNLKAFNECIQKSDVDVQHRGKLGKKGDGRRTILFYESSR